MKLVRHGDFRPRGIDGSVEMSTSTPSVRRKGRPPKDPMTDDAKLVQQVLEATGWSRAKLALELGCTVSNLSRANDQGLKHWRARLAEILKEAQGDQ